VKSDPHGGPVGCDAAQKIEGRKLFLLVDSLGLVLGAAIVPADTIERGGAMTFLEPLVGTFKRLRKLWVEGGFSGDTVADWIKGRRPALQVEVADLAFQGEPVFVSELAKRIRRAGILSLRGSEQGDDRGKQQCGAVKGVVQVHTWSRRTLPNVGSSTARGHFAGTTSFF
jgi:hypothetical protein